MTADDRCAACGVSPREIRDQLISRARARTALMGEAVRLGLSTIETADLLAGRETFPDNATPREDTP